LPHIGRDFGLFCEFRRDSDGSANIERDYTRQNLHNGLQLLGRISLLLFQIRKRRLLKLQRNDEVVDGFILGNLLELVEGI